MLRYAGLSTDDLLFVFPVWLSVSSLVPLILIFLCVRWGRRRFCRDRKELLIPHLFANELGMISPLTKLYIS